MSTENAEKVPKTAERVERFQEAAVCGLVFVEARAVHVVREVGVSPSTPPLQHIWTALPLQNQFIHPIQQTWSTFLSP